MASTPTQADPIRGLPPDALAGRLARLLSRPTMTVDIVSGRASRSFSPVVHTALTRHFTSAGVTVTLGALETAPSQLTSDVVILLCHVHKEEPAYLAALRDGGYPGVVVAWMWDNHHAKEANRRVARLSDLTIAAHDVFAGYLAPHTTLFRSVKLCSTQWTPQEAEELWRSRAPGVRSPELYGGFVRYRGTERTACLEALVASNRYPALRLLDGEGGGYFALDEAARFREWSSHAVSLCLPYRHDLSNRFFDAWLTGQIPIVTPDIPELESSWAAPHLDRHFVRAAGYDAASLDAAHARALALFTSGGAAAEEERHQLALAGHMFPHRIGEIIDLLRGAARHGLDHALHPLANLASRP